MRGISEGGVLMVALALLAVKTAAGVLELSPTVTAKEAALLEQASSVAATNAPAAAALLEAHDRAGASAAVDFALGNFQFQMERYAQAIAAYGEAIRKLPSFRDARKNTGRAWLLLGRDDEAIRVYQDLVADGHQDADIFLLLGHGLMMRRHAVPAESAYRQALLLDPVNRDARRGLIQSLLEQQRLDEVRSLVRSALEDEPAESSLWTLLVNAEVALGDTAAAIRAAETARRLDACTPLTLMLLGDLYLDAGRPAAAVACYDGVRAAGGVETARFLRAVEGLVQMGETARAATLLDVVEKEVVQADPAGTAPVRRKAVRLRADIAALGGDVEHAVALYREVVSADPLDGRALLRLGELLRESGKTGDASLAYERAGRLSGFEVDALIGRARLEVDAGRISEAVGLIEAAQRIEPRPPVARYLEQLHRLLE